MIPALSKNTAPTSEDIKKASLEVSKMFLRTILKNVLPSEEESALFGESHAGTLWKSMYVDTLADACAGHTGIEETIERSIRRKYPLLKKGENLNETI